MKKFFLTILILLITTVTTGCDSDKPTILFNKNPINQNNILDNNFTFQPNERIYYIVLIPKKIYTQNIEIQIIKKDNSYERFGYRLFWTHSARLYQSDIFYYTDYVVIPETGAYIMKVYSKDNPTQELAVNEFFVRN